MAIDGVGIQPDYYIDGELSSLPVDILYAKDTWRHVNPYKRQAYGYLRVTI